MKILFFYIIILFSCSSNEFINLKGEYLSNSSLKKFQKITGIKNQVYFVNETKLILKKNTFNYKTCAILGKGNWYYKNDSLHIEFKKLEWRNNKITDTIEKSKFKNISFHLKDDCLYRVVDIIDGKQLIEFLIKK